MIIYKEDATLDAKEILPPLSLLRIKNNIDSLNAGDVIKVLLSIVNYPEAESDIAAWSNTLGHKILEIEKRDELIIFFIQKSSSRRDLKD
ncbi:MAG: sulfurtransferase TusA family protein [Nitrospirota bacterium]